MTDARQDSGGEAAGALPAYIFADAGSLPGLRETLALLMARSIEAAPIRIVAPAECTAAVRRIAEETAAERMFPPVECVECAAPADGAALDLAAAQAGAAGALVVAAGVRVPCGWDARLARLARDDAGIGTVSPLADAPARFSPLPPNAAGHGAAAVDLDAIDRLVFSLSDRSCVEARGCLPACFFASRQALDLWVEQGAKRGGGAGAALGRMVEAAGLLNAVADCVYVETGAAAGKASPESGPAGAGVDPLEGLRGAVGEALREGVSFASVAGFDARPVQLHVMHSWGGGLERWVRDYCAADRGRVNLILKSVGRWGAFGERIELYSDIGDPAPLRVWEFSRPIRATAAHHLEYARAFAEILHNWCVDAVIVSSFIGHALQPILLCGRPLRVVCHDYYPFCPALNIHFGGVCERCDGERLAACFRDNEHNRFFINVTAPEWLELRATHLRALEASGALLVAPTESVPRHLATLEPAYARLPFSIIPHGRAGAADTVSRVADAGRGEKGTRLRMVVLGRLVPQKGLNLLKACLDGLTRHGDLYLLGCGEQGAWFEGRPGVHVMPGYAPERLAELLGGIVPDVGLLLSPVPETFSYTLSELLESGIPVVATRVGSFADRIEEGVHGYLVEPSAASLLERIAWIDAHRDALAAIRLQLAGLPHRSLHDMVADYHALTPLQERPPMRCPLGGAALSSRAEVRIFLDFRTDQGFQRFLEHAETYLERKVMHTPRLRSWQKKIAARGLGAAFGLMRRLFARFARRAPRGDAA